MELTIYGASDDLIEVEGTLREEYPCDGEGTLIVIGPHGEVVEVHVELDAEWSASAKIVRPPPFPFEVDVRTIPRPDDPESGDMAIKLTFHYDPSEIPPDPLIYQGSR